jgi:alkanesulfonate monooxygenase SsuD/methylene tetrahydromethanopterin reductase-like flavin-dependent oxidoreductase (luciferase family)
MVMVKLGYKLMSEEHGPAALVRRAQRAEKAGFDFAAISDHFFPWLEEQGHSPFAWSVLGAAAHATERLGLMTSVTCPTMRYPANASRSAWGPASAWPGVVERRERFAKAIDIIQGLLSGQITNYRGDYQCASGA